VPWQKVQRLVETFFQQKSNEESKRDLWLDALRSSLPMLRFL
jgi:hypothetical protein